MDACVSCFNVDVFRFCQQLLFGVDFLDYTV